jgi:hypothetical protein
MVQNNEHAPYKKIEEIQTRIPFFVSIILDIPTSFSKMAEKLVVSLKWWTIKNNSAPKGRTWDELLIVI